MYNVKPVGTFNSGIIRQMDFECGVFYYTIVVFQGKKWRELRF